MCDGFLLHLYHLYFQGIKFLAYGYPNAPQYLLSPQKRISITFHQCSTGTLAKVIMKIARFLLRLITEELS